jgi:hypothetical protein
VGHRRWLANKKEPWRRHGELFNGEDELRGPPRRRSRKEIQMLLNNWVECPTSRKKKKEPTPLSGVWKRKSVFWDLPYWHVFGTPHCLDVMHITKNMRESLLATLFNIPDKTKDGPKARQDQIDLNIRHDLQVRQPP